MRKDLSWRHATAADLDRVSYIQTISRWTQDTGLSKRAIRVLGFFAALNRLGTYGYRGTRCSQPALARAVSRATGEAASVPTIQRALKELHEEGFLAIGTAYGRPRKTFPDVFQREPIRIYSITTKAAALWSFRGQNSLHVPTSIKKEPFRSGELEIRISKPACAAAELDRCASQDRVNRNEVNEMTIFERGFAAKSHETGKEQKSRPSRFQSVPERSVSSARKNLLQDICSIVSGRGRAGKMIAAKAALCLSDPQADSAIDWQFWLTRWPMMTRGERVCALRTEIVPVLNTWIASLPKSIERITPEFRTTPKITDAVDGLRSQGWDADLLAKIAARCG